MMKATGPTRLMKRQLLACVLVMFGLSSVPAEDSAPDTSAAVAHKVLTESGVKGGLVVHLDCGDGTLTGALRVNDRYLVHGLERDPQNVAVARRNIQTLGFYGPVSVETWEGSSLPYADNLVNLVVAEKLDRCSMEEVLRVLAPLGVAYVRTADGWRKTVKPWPREMGEWTHYRQGPGNNPVTPDTLVGPPRGLQWSCEPLWSRSHAFTTSFTAMVSAQGRVFYIQDEAPTGIAQDAVPEQWTLIARDAFNGILLWKQPLSPWGVEAWKNPTLRFSPTAGTDCLVAHKDRVMMTLGYQSAVSILDAATGRIVGVCEGTDGALELRCENDILLVNRAGESLMAFDARDARPLWKIDARIAHLMINSGRVMYFDQTTKALVCLRLEDGTSLWQNPAVRPKTAMAHNGYVVLGPDLQVLSVETGKVLWTKTMKETISGHKMFVSQDQIWILSQNDKHVISFDLATGEERTVIDTADSIATERFTLADLFKKADYHTAVIGKWHLGLGPGAEKGGTDWNGEVKPGPLEIGFDYSYLIPSTNDRVPCVYLRNHRVVNLDPNDPIFISGKSITDKPGSTQYPNGRLTPEAMTTMKSVKGHNSSVINGIGRMGYMVGGKAALWDDYTVSDVLVEEARKYISSRKNDQPFFLYFPSQCIHVPRTPNKRFQGKTELGPRGDSMVEFDWKVGEIMKALKEKGVLENTIVVLSSDNGPVYIDGYADGTTIDRKNNPGEEFDRGHDGSGPYRGGKYQPHDGATRVPFVISWPGKIEPGGVSDALVGQIDFLASFAALLGVDIPEGEAKDSRNLLPVFMGESDKGVEYLLQGFKAQKALRYKNWKYIPPRRKASVPEQLYNLDQDVGEQDNIIEQNPEMAQHMRDMLKKILAADAIKDLN